MTDQITFWFETNKTHSVAGAGSPVRWPAEISVWLWLDSSGKDHLNSHSWLHGIHSQLFHLVFTLRLPNQHIITNVKRRSHYRAQSSVMIFLFFLSQSRSFCSDVYWPISVNGNASHATTNVTPMRIVISNTVTLVRQTFGEKMSDISLQAFIFQMICCGDQVTICHVLRMRMRRRRNTFAFLLSCFYCCYNSW